MSPRLPWIFRVVLRAYPSRFRTAHGSEVAEVITSRLAHARSAGGSLALAYVTLLVDLVVNLPLEWVSAGRRTQRRRLSSTLLPDLRISLRRLRRAPGFTAAAVLSLGVAIGGTTLVYSLVRTVLLDPLPYPESERLFVVGELRDGERVSVAWPNFRDWRDGVTTAELAAFGRSSMNLTGDGPAERLRGLRVTPNLFDALGVAFQLGRSPEAPGEVVLTHAIWANRYGSDPAILGRSIQLDGTGWTVTGVLPPGIEFPDGVVLGASDIYTSIEPVPADFENRGSHPGLAVVARLHSGRTLVEARSELDALAHSLALEYPDTNGRSAVVVQDALTVVSGSLRRPLGFLGGAALVLLLAAIGNVAGLGLTRAVARSGEWGLRRALGAGTHQLMRQVGIEYLILGVTATLVGVCGAMVLLPRLVAWGPIAQMGISGRIGRPDIALALALGAVATALVATPPLFRALTATRVTPGARRATSPVRTRESLVAGQLALATVLLVVAATLGRSLMQINAVDGGIRPANVVAFRVALPEADYPDEGEVSAFFAQLQERLEALPGAGSVGGISTLPFSGSGSQSGIRTLSDPAADPLRTDVNVVDGDYFTAAGVELVRGRLLSDADNAEAPPVVVVDETFAARMWPDRDPLGRSITGWGFQSAEVVGVVRHVKNYGVTRPSREELYVSHGQRAYRSMWMLVRGETSAHPAPMIRAVINDIDPNLPIASFRLMDEVVASTVSEVRLATGLGLALAALVALIAVIGLRSTAAYGVQLRVREFGIRMALGSESGRIRRQVLQRSALVTGAGILVGLGAALITTRVIESLVFGVPRIDPTSFGLAVAVIALVSVAAGDGPARKAAACDPAATLREE